MPHVSHAATNPNRVILSAVTVLIVLAGAPAGTGANPAESPTPPDTTHSERHFETSAPSDGVGPDSAAIFGDGLNTGQGPIVRMGPRGEEMKDVGSRVWRPLAAKGASQLEQDAQALRERKISLKGHLPITMAIAVEDSASLGRLLALGDTIACAPPCTVVVRSTIRHFYELGERGISCWEYRPPESIRQPTGSAPPKAPPGSGQSSGGRRASAAPAAGEAVAGPVVFSEGFETEFVPGSSWSAADYNSYNGLDYWGDVICGAAHGGSWIVSAAWHGDVGCAAYDNNQTADLENVSSIYMGSYSSFTVSFWVNCNMESGYDFLSFQAGGAPNPLTQLIEMTGSSGGWVQRQWIFDNSGHAYDNLYLRFVFASDNSITAAGGILLDDIQVTANSPNLLATTPTGWSGPIVPSMSFGTTTTGANLLTGQFTNIDWAIRNADTGSAGGFYVDYYLDNGWIGSDYVFSLSANTTYTRTDWGYVVNTAGTHTLKMVIDPTGSITESNEGDNTYQAAFTWSNPPAPDLIVQSVTVTAQTPPAAPAMAPALLETGSAVAYTFTMGQTVDIAVTVRNQGTAATGGSCALDWYKNRGSPPAYGTRGEQSVTVGTLGAGASTVLHFYATGTKAETWNMYLLADATNAVDEGSTEGNNSHGPVQTVWASRLIYVTGTFFYDDSLLGTTTTPCNDVMVIDTGDPNGIDTLGAAAVCCWDTGRFIIGPIANVDTDDDNGFLDLKVRVNYRSNENCWNLSYPGSWLVTMVKDDGTPWAFESGVTEDFAGDTLDVGLLKPTGYGDRWALHMMKTIAERGWAWVRDRCPTSIGLGPLTVQWSPGYSRVTSYAVNTSTIHINGSSTPSWGYTPDEADDSWVLHEYGHHVSSRMGFDMSPGGDHTINGPSPSLELAWGEGWGHFFGLFRQWGPPSQTIRNRGVDGLGIQGEAILDLERGLVTLSPHGQVDTLNASGPLFEVSIASLLYDVMDSEADNQNGDASGDSLADGIETLWSVLRDSNPSHVPAATVIRTVFDFRSVYQAATYTPNMWTDRYKRTWDLFWEHGIQGGVTGISDYDQAPPPTWNLHAKPNPFRRNSVIAITIPEVAKVAPIQVKLYDVQGRLVTTLSRGLVGPGLHEVRWDGNDRHGRKASAGVYFCRLEGPGMKRTVRLVKLQ
ncbi:MAG: CARDB domain-containing protein [Candidatus Eisenbacteria bacterium]